MAYLIDLADNSRVLVRLKKGFNEPIVDLRLQYKNQQTQSWGWTKKGFIIPMNKISNLIDILNHLNRSICPKCNEKIYSDTLDCEIETD